MSCLSAVIKNCSLILHDEYVQPRFAAYCTYCVPIQEHVKLFKMSILGIFHHMLLDNNCRNETESTQGGKKSAYINGTPSLCNIEEPISCSRASWEIGNQK